MYQRDYILRMIEMMGDFIAAVLKMLQNKQFPEVSKMMENAYFDFLKEDAAFFRSIPYGELTNDLIYKHNYTHGHLEILSELFYAEAELNFCTGNYRDSLVYFEKSLVLLEYLVRESGIYSLQKEERIAAINKKVSSLKNTLREQ